MSEDRHEDRPAGADDQELGAAIGEAVAREADSPVVPPPVADIAERAGARARARRVRHGVVGIAAAAALIAGGLVAWSELRGGDGNLQVATRPTVPERSEPATSEPDPATAERADQPGESQPDGAGSKPAAAPPAGPSGDGSSPVDLRPTDPPAADPGGAQDPDSGSQEPESTPLTPEALSTGPTLTWAEVSLDTPPGIVDIQRLVSVGDGRIAARAWGEAGDRIVVTDDGTTWTAVPTPAGIAPGLIDIAGARWVVAGVDASGPERTDRVFYSDDEGATWTELTVDVGSGAGPLPSHCVMKARVTAVLTSGDRMVAVVETYTDLDLHGLLVASGRAPDRDSILHWRYTESALVVYLGTETDAESIEIPFDELGLAPGQQAPCAGPDGRHEQRVHVLTSDGAGTDPAGRYDGSNTSALGTAEGFFITLRTDEGELLVTSPDGRTWTEHPIGAQGYVPVTAGPDGAAWRSFRTYDSYRIERLDPGGSSGTVAEFEGLRPGPILTAGPAGVVTTAELITRTGADSPPEFRIAKDGYELRLDQAWGDMALWDLAGDVAVYRFAAPEIMFEASLRETLRFVTEDDGSQTLVFKDPDTGDDLVAFTAADLERAAAQFLAGPGAFEPPPTWIGWSTGGTSWGWQDTADAFGIDTGGTYPAPVELAVGADFVLARVQVGTGGGAVSTGGGESQPTPPRSSDTRWFIAPAP